MEFGLGIPTAVSPRNHILGGTDPLRKWAIWGFSGPTEKHWNSDICNSGCILTLGQNIHGELGQANDITEQPFSCRILHILPKEVLHSGGSR